MAQGEMTSRGSCRPDYQDTMRRRCRRRGSLVCQEAHVTKFIQIEHKETKGKATVPEASLKQVWAAKGWTKITKSTRKKGDN